MTTRLILIAHAETSATRKGVFPDDPGLDPRGTAAGVALAGTLPFAAEVLTSPAIAARETVIALGQSGNIEPALADLDVGTWRGRSVMDIGMQDPESATAWIEDPAFAGHGGESFADLVARVSAWLETRRTRPGLTIAVTHAAVLRAAAIAVLGAPVGAIWRIEAAPLAQLVLSSDGRRWTMKELRSP